MLMCLTGLFLGFFLLIHFLGNLQLFLPQEQAHLQFNAYSHFLSGNIVIKIVSLVLYTSIILHAIDGLVITIKNKNLAVLISLTEEAEPVNGIPVIWGYWVR
jgi:succinate dehydrogenase / fumarate reductase cytochrome b subunit